MKWRGNIYGCDLDLPNNAETCGFQAKNKKSDFCECTKSIYER